MRKLAAAICLCFCLSICACGEDEKYIALTFDDGPTGKYTEHMLEALARQEVHATFFLCGYRVSQYPELTEKIAAQGHEIGLHGCSHRYFSHMSTTELECELTKECFEIGEITGEAPYFLRPPGGLLPKELPQDSVCRQFPVILWSVDPQDWATDSRQTIVQRVLQKVKPGDIVLLHDSSSSSVEAAEEIIITLRQQGYEFVTVSRLAELYKTKLQSGCTYYYFRKREQK